MILISGSIELYNHLQFVTICPHPWPVFAKLQELREKRQFLIGVDSYRNSEPIRNGL